MHQFTPLSPIPILQYNNKSMEVQQQLAAIQEQLRQYAQQLGELNLANNQYQQANEALSAQIQTITQKINKKKHRIEQENKDKHIIHQKLVKAEKVKEELEIKHALSAERERKVKEHQERMRQQQERAREQQEKAKEAERQRQLERAKKDLAEKPIEERPISLQPQVVKPLPKQQQPIKQQKLPTKAVIKPNAPSPSIPQQAKLQVKPEAVTTFDNSDKGQYQPPALFMDEGSDEEDEEDNSKTLEILKSKLRMDSKELHDEDDD